MDGAVMRHARQTPALAVTLGYLALSAVMTWPLMRDVSSELGGNPVDPGQTLWGFWWWRYAGDFGDRPFFSRMLWWPDGVPLWFQTWDLPAALAVWPLWDWLPDTALYNLPLFASFPLSGFTFYLLCRSLWGGTLGPFLAGCLYTFSTFHFAHATSTLHIASMQWLPLFFLGLLRAVREPGMSGAWLAGIGLALATLTSPYHLLSCVLGGAVVLGVAVFHMRAPYLTRQALAKWGVFVGVFALLAGWLLAGMANSYLKEAFIGNHDAFTYSADLHSFFVPNWINLWSRALGDFQSWRGMPWEYGSYIGYVAWILALAGAFATRAARPFIGIAVLGAILALGPQLHAGGTAYGSAHLPYAWLQQAFPLLAFGGMPLRLTWLTTFGVAVAAGAALCALCQGRRPVKLLAVAATVLALVEIWPRPFPMTRQPHRAMMQQWALDTSSWAVLDGTVPTQALLHQMQHRHPILGGYVTRPPERVFAALRDDPFLSAFFWPPIGRAVTPRLPVSPEEALHILTALRIKFVILDATRAPIAREIGLLERYQGEGIFIYEVVQRRPI